MFKIIDTNKIERLKRIQMLMITFLIGCVVGWVYEEIFYYITENWVGNRGFLYGPYLPVYGVGAVLMVLFLDKFRKSPFLVFVSAILITGVLEYLTGFVMWEIFHHRWWDYTNEFLNLQGYVCLRSLISFAIGGLALIYVIEPMEHNLIENSKRKVINFWCYLGLFMIIIDFIITLLTRY